jgi:hypothetical protein
MADKHARLGELLGAIGLVANSALSLAEGRLLRRRGASGG